MAGDGKVAPFQQRVEEWQYVQRQRAWRNQPFFHAPIVVHSVVDSLRETAAWILVDHVSVEEFFADGVWRRATFHYAVWLFEQTRIEPTLLLEDVVQKQHPEEGPANTYDLAQDIDRVAIGDGCIFVRDRRKLQSEGDLL